jgi:hypothetical protein
VAESDCVTQSYKGCYPSVGEGADIRWFDSCGNPETIIEDCLDKNSQCSLDSDGIPFCECTNHWEGEDCQICPQKWDDLADCNACKEGFVYDPDLDDCVYSPVDILFVVDNSGSMVGEQKALAHAINTMLIKLEDVIGDNYQIGIITTGLESENCPACDDIVTNSCINETGENGRLQDRIGKNQGTEEDPDFVFSTDQSCRIVTKNNIECLYNETEQAGTIMVGESGCGYERGLDAIRIALSEPLLGGHNAGFLRPEAALLIVVITDEDDCGKVGDVDETLPGIMADVCYYAAKGEDPYGNTSDINGKAYTLTPVQEYYDRLVELKGEGNVRFAVVVGMQDPQDPGASEIEYEYNTLYNMYRPINACMTPGCDIHPAYCSAKPGTRYIQLALMFGGNGFLSTICQADFSTSLDQMIDHFFGS